MLKVRHAAPRSITSSPTPRAVSAARIAAVGNRCVGPVPNNTTSGFKARIGSRCATVRSAKLAGSHSGIRVSAVTMQLACSRCSPIRISWAEYPRIRLTRELASSVNFIDGTIPPVREIVIVISDLYFPPREPDPSNRKTRATRTGAASGNVGVAGTPDPTAGAGAIGTLPGFEHAARFGQRRSIEGEGGWRPWLARWLGRADLASVAPAVIAAAAAPSGKSAVTPAAATPNRNSTVTPPAAAPTRDGTAWIATPVHLIAGLTSLHLDRRSILRLPTADLESFANDFNRTFAGSDLFLRPLPSGDFLLHGPATLTGSTTDPARALAADLEASLPKGTDAKPLKRLGSELEMWLHATPLNEVRQRRGEVPVSALWLWGGGPYVAFDARPSTNATSQSAAATTSAESAAAAERGTQPPHTKTDLAFGTDPYLAGLWCLHGDHPGVLPDQLNTLLGDPLVNGPHAQRAVLVAEVTPILQSNPHWSIFEALADLDRRLVSPALTTLRRGTLESVTLIANDTELRVRRHDHLRFWRRHQSTLMALQQ
jgi:hypothetical protein